MNRLLPALLMPVSLLLVACGGDNADSSPTATPTLADSESVKTTPVAQASPSATAAAASPTPGTAPAGAQPLSLRATDGSVTMKAYLYAPPGPKRKIVVIGYDVGAGGGRVNSVRASGVAGGSVGAGGDRVGRGHAQRGRFARGLGGGFAHGRRDRRGAARFARHVQSERRGRGAMTS